MTSRSDEVGKHEKPGLGTFLSIMLSSNSDTEVIMAARQARKLLKAEGRSGNDVAQALERRDQLLEAARQLKAERDQLLGENERLKRLQQSNGADSSFAQALWQPAGMPASVDNRTAQWLLNLDQQGRIHLTRKETGLVQSCASRRRLSQAQREWLRDITANAVGRTGQTPPQ